MTVFVADHRGELATSSQWLRPVHIGAAVAPVAGIEPDTTVPDSLSGKTAYADLRLYDYVAKAYEGRCEFVAIQQYRRQFFLGVPDPANRVLLDLRSAAAVSDEGQFEIDPRQRDAYLFHLRGVSDHDLWLELDGAAIIANRWSFGEVSVEDQYLGSIADLYPGEVAYIDAWHDMRSLLEGLAGSDVVAASLGATFGYFNNCFVTSWAEFRRYSDFLFEVLDGLQAYDEVFRIYGYLAERVFCVYAALQASTRPDFTIRSRSMMFTA